MASAIGNISSAENEDQVRSGHDRPETTAVKIWRFISFFWDEGEPTPSEHQRRKLKALEWLRRYSIAFCPRHAKKGSIAFRSGEIQDIDRRRTSLERNY